jgi:hypothetical protein
VTKKVTRKINADLVEILFQDNTYPWKGDGWCPTPPETVTAFQVVPRTKVVIEYEVWDADEAP